MYIKSHPSFLLCFSLSLDLFLSLFLFPSPGESKAATHHSGSSGGSSAGSGHTQQHGHAQQQGQHSPYNQTPTNPLAQYSHTSPGATRVGESAENSNANNPINGAAVHPFPAIRMKHSMSTSSGFTSVSQQNLRGGHATMPAPDQVSIRSMNAIGAHAGLGLPANLRGSRESFQEALDNPCEYFIDVM